MARTDKTHTHQVQAHDTQASESSTPGQRIAITPGEPAGIGPDLLVTLAQQPRDDEWVAVCDPDLITDRARLLGLDLSLREYQAGKPPTGDTGGSLCIAPHPLPHPVTPGVLNSNNASYVLKTLDTAVSGCLSGSFSSMVTGPVQKSVINDAGFNFTGHTEYIADITGGIPVMMLMANGFRVALMTTHLPLSQVAGSITKDLITTIIDIINDDLKRSFGIANPAIIVCGLNPHAGEGGHLGTEEITTIEPALDHCRARGINVTGPLPADTLFTPKHLDNADIAVAMYHDQGLPVLKYAGFGEAVNITLGLPIVRTSVDHGTALDLAGSGQAHAGSLEEAIQQAKLMGHHRALT